MLKLLTVSLSMSWMYDNLKNKVMIVSGHQKTKERAMSKLGGNMCDLLNYKATFNESELKKT